MKVLKVFAVIITDKQERTFSDQSSSISDNVPAPTSAFWDAIELDSHS